MILQSWAELLLHASAPPDTIDLHIKDTLAAFLAGVRTKDGQALSRLYGGRGDPAELAAAAAGIARLSECDDIHLASCVTPGSVVIPVALAFAGRNGRDDFNRAVSAGYAAGLRLGIGIGGAKALAGGVWPTLFAAPLMAAVTASCLSGHNPGQLAQAMALALAGANGRPGRPAGAPSGRWFMLAEAVARGIRVSEAAGQGFHGDLNILSKPWLTVQAGQGDIDMGAFEPSAPMPSICDVGYKPFPIARQALSAVLAFQTLLSNGLDPRRIDRLEVQVPSLHWSFLTRKVEEGDRLSQLVNVGYQLACAALAPELLGEHERGVRPDLRKFGNRVVVISNNRLDAHLPVRWAAKIVVASRGRQFEETVVRNDFDHDAPGLAQRLSDKWRRLLPEEDSCMVFEGDGPSGRDAELWQQIEARVTMAARREG